MMKTRAGRHGLHVFDRDTGWNMLAEEVQVPPSKWSVAPETLSIALLNDCDLACPFCYASKRPARLEEEEVLAWVKSAADHGCLSVGFGGGEPTLYPNFAKLCHRVRQSTDVAVTFTTHGHNLTERYIEPLEGAVDLVRVSMDGVGDVYESLRGRPFSQLIDTIHRLGKKLRFGIATLVNASTIHCLDEVCSVCLAEEASELLILPEWSPEGIRLSQDELRWLEDWIARHKDKLSLRVSELAAPFVKTEYLNLPSYDNNKDALEATFDFMHIDACGNLKSSSFGEESGVPMREHSGLTKALRLYRERLGNVTGGPE